MKSKKQQKAAKQPGNGKAAAAKTAVSAAPKTTKSEQPAAEPKHTIKQLVIRTLAANCSATNDEIIAAVKAEFPKSAFKDTHAAWYRSQARKGLLTGAPIAIPAMSRKQSTTAK
jgi:hypothetical protein